MDAYGFEVKAKTYPGSQMRSCGPKKTDLNFARLPKDILKYTEGIYLKCPTTMSKKTASSCSKNRWDKHGTISPGSDCYCCCCCCCGWFSRGPCFETRSDVTLFILRNRPKKKRFIKPQVALEPRWKPVFHQTPSRCRTSWPHWGWRQRANRKLGRMLWSASCISVFFFKPES